MPRVVASEDDRDGIRVAHDQVVRAGPDDVAVSLEEFLREQVLPALHRVIHRPQSRDLGEDRAWILGKGV
jgi:hypothetical protein